MINCKFCPCADIENCDRCVDPHLNDNWDYKCKCVRRNQCLCNKWICHKCKKVTSDNNIICDKKHENWICEWGCETDE